jgi:hypothetical protein
MHPNIVFLNVEEAVPKRAARKVAIVLTNIC